jgi:RimJ/RimL family protein N-acetyltransferase
MTVTVRAATDDDVDAVRGLYRHSSARSLYLRYFSSAVDVDRAVDDLLRRAPEGEVAVAVDEGDVVGVGSYVRLDDPRTAEISLIVDDAHQHHGVGHLLLGHLAAHARDHGVTRLRAEVLTENVTMLHLCAHCGLRETAVLDGPVVDVALTL